MPIDAGLFSPYGYRETVDVYGGCVRSLGIQTASAVLLIGLAACDSSDQVFASVAGGLVSAAITQSLSTSPQPGYRVSGNAVTGYVVTGNGGSDGGGIRTGGHAGAVPSTALGSNGLPQTPQCDQYFAFARTLTNNLNPLIEKYKACMNSAPNHPAVKAVQCGPAKYIMYVGAQRMCV